MTTIEYFESIIRTYETAMRQCNYKVQKVKYRKTIARFKEALDALNNQTKRCPRCGKKLKNED